MTFDEILEQVRELVQSKGRVAYRALKRRFALDDEYLEDLKSELIKAERVAMDEDGEVLVWVGAVPVVSSQLSVVSPQPPIPHTQPPISYTPPHLAERIRATPADRGRTQDDYGAVCRPQRLDGADRRTRSRRSPRDH